MKSDINGCSTCAVGQEQYEEFTSYLGRKQVKKIQYDYRHTNKELFSGVFNTIDQARSARDKWLQQPERIRIAN